MAKFTCADGLDVRLWGRVNKTEFCWLWTGCGSRGYGAISYRGKLWKVHRLAYTILVGPIPDGLTLDHLCRNKLCCNPTHLEPVTGKVNTLRGDTITGRNAKATHCKRGHPFDAANTGNWRGKRICRRCAVLNTIRCREAKRLRQPLVNCVGGIPE